PSYFSRSTLFPYTTLFRSRTGAVPHGTAHGLLEGGLGGAGPAGLAGTVALLRLEDHDHLLGAAGADDGGSGAAHGGHGLRRVLRSEEHTSELQSRFDLVCR